MGHLELSEEKQGQHRIYIDGSTVYGGDSLRDIVRYIYVDMHSLADPDTAHRCKKRFDKLIEKSRTAEGTEVYPLKVGEVLAFAAAVYNREVEDCDYEYTIEDCTPAQAQEEAPNSPLAEAEKYGKTIKEVKKAAILLCDACNTLNGKKFSYAMPNESREIAEKIGCLWGETVQYMVELEEKRIGLIREYMESQDGEQ